MANGNERRIHPRSDWSDEHVRDVERMVARDAYATAYAAGTADGKTVTLPCQCACGFSSTSFATPLCFALDQKGNDR